jgi:hypothetical protein
MSVETPRMRRDLPGWARIAVVPLVVILFLGGLWLVGGVVTDDFRSAQALTAVWFLGFGAAALGLAWRRADLRLPVGATFIVTAAVVGGFLAWSTLRDSTVNEKVATGRPFSQFPLEATPQNVTLAQGRFSGLAHETAGTASVVGLENGGRKLTLTGFETDPGPDLFVYLVAGGNPTETADHKSLGSLKGNKGNQQYTIPAAVDIRRYDTVVIWCRAFSVAFGAAELRAA